MINCAIIGINGFGRVHYNDLLREVQKGRCALRAAVIRPRHWDDPEVAKLKAQGTEIFADYQEMLQKCGSALDLCCIPTAIAQHLPMTKAALQAGVNVFVEKPVTPTYREALEMQAAEKASGKFVAVGYQDIYQLRTQKIKELILSGVLGRVKSLKCLVLWPRPLSYYQRNSWAGQLFGAHGEPILDAPFTNATAHFLNLLNFYAGNTFEATAELKSLDAVMTRCNDITSCDTAGVSITTRDDKKMLFLCSHATDQTSDPDTIIQCEKGTITYNMQQTTVTTASGEVLAQFKAPDYVGTRQTVMDAVLKKITNPEQFVCTIDLAAQAVRLGNAIFDATPIVEVPKSEVEEITTEKQTQRSVRNLAEVLKQCFAEDRLPGTADFAWLPTAGHLDFTNYQGFEGRFYK